MREPIRTAEYGSKAPDGTAARYQVLVVDDEANIREVIGQYLALDGFKVLLAADGDEALRLAASEPVDLVLLDLMLPGIDAWEVCHRLRARSPVPIVFLTPRAGKPAMLPGFARGPDAYSPNPSTPPAL